MQVAISSLSMRFGNRKLFSNLSMVFPSGGMTAIMAPSGYGKSTLLSVIAGQIAPQQGSVVLSGGSDEGILPAIAWIVQSSPMLSRRSSIDNAALGALGRGYSHEDAHAVAADALARLNISHLAGTPVNRISGGERQRVAVARAIAMKSSLILADEPTASLDSSSRDLVSRALRTAAATPSTVIIATHDESVAKQCDRIFHLDSLSDMSS